MSETVARAMGGFLPWARAEVALALLAIDPGGLGGLWLRARAGPVRDRVMAALAALPQPVRRIHPGIGDDALFGGLDLAASLAEGRSVSAAGVLADDPSLILAMAERTPGGLAVRLGQWLDRGGRTSLVALDEAATEDEGLPPALADRLALFLDLGDIGWGASRDIRIDPARLAAARARVAQVAMPPDAPDAMVRAAATLGIASLRAPILALRAARASAAWRGAVSVGGEDLALAAALVLAHRAVPGAETETDDPPDPPPDEGDAERPDPTDIAIPDDLLVEAARAALPADLLARLAAGRAARAASGAAGTGDVRRGNRRGRPLPPTPGRPDGQARIDPVATLRAAAPWQAVRRRLSDRAGLLIRPSDFRVRRFRECADRVLIFTVDASGSAALARLGEAKGAIELLLAQAYARRDHVALVAFRGKGADLLLPPTRSLVQTKRRLSGLPGGGGTPLAAGLRLAGEVARLCLGRGMTPTVALLTDGRANIALDGRADRAAAVEEAARMARALALAGVPGLVIDTAIRPQPDLARLAAGMGAAYLPLPRADARRMAAALAGALAS